MGDKNMTESARQEFLAALHVGVLGVERAEGPPLVVPVWYSYVRGGDLTILMSSASLKGRLLAAAGRATLCVQQETLPYKYVSVEGPIAIESLTTDAQPEVERMAVRYLGEEMGRQYADAEIADDEIKVTLSPERWFSVDYG
jgi:PPOX class probable F420-dependent enzyme